MYVLGIETSCDETSVAVVKNGKAILSNIVASSLPWHKKYGGVVPEIAFRKQLEFITPAADAALKEAGVRLRAIGLISVTHEPGLMGSLLVGTSFAQGLSLAAKLPLLEVNHLHSHIYAALLPMKKIPLPLAALVVSGGHTNLFHIRDFAKIETLGATHDDACGEAFDKVAKILRLGYPGGPLIERLAKYGNPKAVRFNCAAAKHPFDFSFSGIKTAVLYYVKSRKSKLALSQKRDICASFQETVVDTLIEKSISACAAKNAHRLAVAGGVAANSRLREKFKEACRIKGIEVYFPSKPLCMDNAAMVAGLAYHLYKR